MLDLVHVDDCPNVYLQLLQIFIGFVFLLIKNRSIHYLFSFKLTMTYQ